MALRGHACALAQIIFGGQNTKTDPFLNRSVQAHRCLRVHKEERRAAECTTHLHLGRGDKIDLMWQSVRCVVQNLTWQRLRRANICSLLSLACSPFCPPVLFVGMKLESLDCRVVTVVTFLTLLLSHTPFILSLLLFSSDTHLSLFLFSLQSFSAVLEQENQCI